MVRIALGGRPDAFAGLRRAAFFLVILLVSSTLATAQEKRNQPARHDYQQVAAALEPFIEREMTQTGIPGLSIAIVDDQQIVWAQGFGMADAKAGKSATAETVYRIGSVSKLFTDI